MPIKFRSAIFSSLFFLPLSVSPFSRPALAAEDAGFQALCQQIAAPEGGRVVCADLVALEQTLVYNRFGSFNPYGMIYALRRDVVSAQATVPEISAEYCAGLTGAEGGGVDLQPGQVRLKDCKRPRPVTLRVNVGDLLLLRVENLLTPTNPPDFSQGFCRDTAPGDQGRKRVRIGQREGDAGLVAHGEADCVTSASTPKAVAPAHAPDWPQTRLMNLVAQGLHPLPDPETGAIRGECRGLQAVAPGDSFLCLYSVDQEGTHFFGSLAAPAGGEGDGGSIVHGLFGAVLAERQGSRWYRSQVSQTAMDAAWGKAAAVAGNPHARSGKINYEVASDGVPILNMARALDAAQVDFDTASHLELVHSDLNAIIWCNDALPDGPDGKRQDCRAPTDGGQMTTEPGFHAFREFSVFFHDELKAFYTRNFRELGQLGQLAGVKDGFAINYGASGMGSLLLANRKGIGPAADCMECLYEEFFLTSWANGDPALLEWYADDPSNVHHSYLNDPVVFRNFHAGPKETHVFHLHAHQWFAGNDPNRGSYLDSQTVGPQQGFTYNIYHGGLRGQNGAGQGWWDTQGSGNRNRTLGDSIFHCHLYPHFAQGMWALWRVHDVFEDGTRKLPDGQADAGLSLDFAPRGADGLTPKRSGSVDPQTGAWIANAEGTPVPAIVPLPGEALPLLPTYAVVEGEVPMPGYPFYVAGKPGHRPPQAPLDIARDIGPNPGATLPDGTDGRSAGTGWLDGGLSRHVIADGSTRELGAGVPALLDDGSSVASLTGDRKAAFYGQLVAKAFAIGDLGGHLTRANLSALSPWGQPLERAAMGFHFNGLQYAEGGGSGAALKLAMADGTPVTGQVERGAYPSPRAPRPDHPGTDDLAQLFVNGSAPKPGAPFADPCGNARGAAADTAAMADPLGLGWLTATDFLPDPRLDGFRRYEVSAVQLDMVVNSAGWHDPQARINVLTAESDTYKDGPDWRVSPVISDSEEPFFFRALSGECIEFRHTNELPKELELDDFQVKTPTDTIGQHIHLVKFDVTSSDGSGNGWNYEDGTFAPDELASRLCAWSQASTEAQGLVTNLSDRIRAAMTSDEAANFPAAGLCEWQVYKRHDLWRLERSRFPFLFQTTVQRWFADPILSDDGKGAVDRTMRTVFSHDHFGPSSIQQHGFYSALVVEPPARVSSAGGAAGSDAIRDNWFPNILPPGEGEGDRPLLPALRKTSVAWGGKAWEGAQKRVVLAPNKAAADGDHSYFQHPNYREFMLSIADFALLYDPRDREAPILNQIAAGSQDLAGGLEGMARLYCEAYWRLSPWPLANVCGVPAKPDANGYHFPGEMPPAFLAAGAYRDDAHRARYAGDLFGGTPMTTAAPEVVKLGAHLTEYRQKAAGTWKPGQANTTAAMAKPVAGPARPEAISVDHHDPYLVNYRGAPIPLRIATKNADGSASGDCAPKQMNRAGGFGPSAVVDALVDGSFGQCSLQYQRAGDDGDLGRAFSSRSHGDPETPVLEAYQGERLAIRMIQGAQEVQHTFNIAGQPFRRNIDQVWPQGMQPLGLSAAKAAAPSLQAACFARARVQHSDPRDYRKWADTAPGRWPEVGIDPTFWQDYEAALAQCDNIEGFAFAQEIGISEHFEMQGSLRADVNASAEYVPASRGDSRHLTDAKVPLNSSDYFYNFGTLDALWNGAWGLVRVYKGPESYDPATLDLGAPDPVTPASVKIGDRITRVASFRAGEESSGPNAVPGSQTGLACPISAPGETQRIVDAVIAAVATRNVFPDQKGTVYGDGLYDPDGLFLALLSPDQLGLAIDDNAGFAGLTVDAVRAAIRAAYPTQPEPFVLRAHAGDCLRLRVVNLLGDPAGAGDALGDAILPRIVPLNVDPIPHQDEAGGWLLDRPEGPASGVRPSTRLALSLGLPGLDLIREVPQGFGFNADALAGSGGSGLASSSGLLVTYAGRMRMDLPDDVDAAFDAIAVLAARQIYQTLAAEPRTAADGTLIGLFADRMREVAAKNLQGNALDAEISNHFSLLIPGMNKPPLLDKDGRPVQILGDPVVLQLWDNSLAPYAGEINVEGCPAGGCTDDPDALNRQLADTVQGGVRIALDARTHWIPYAFGAVPVRPLADPISQIPHGLFGAIDVVPTNWQAVSDDGLDGPVEADGYAYYQARHVAPEGPGQSFLWTATDQGGSQIPLREFVLFWRDGMNLWDDRNAPSWRWSDSQVPVAGRKMVPDCIVCDDSYDRGEAGVSNSAHSFSRVLAAGGSPIPRSTDLNGLSFSGDYLASAAEKLELLAQPGEQIVIRVVHPGGRARQRAFVMNNYSYDDLFPGFGFPHSAMLAPGKAISAWLGPRAEPGTAVWFDGPATLRGAGTWGLLTTQGADGAAGE